MVEDVGHEQRPAPRHASADHPVLVVIAPGYHRDVGGADETRHGPQALGFFAGVLQAPVRASSRDHDLELLGDDDLGQASVATAHASWHVWPRDRPRRWRGERSHYPPRHAALSAAMIFASQKHGERRQIESLGLNPTARIAWTSRSPPRSCPTLDRKLAQRPCRHVPPVRQWNTRGSPDSCHIRDRRPKLLPSRTIPAARRVAHPAHRAEHNRRPVSPHQNSPSRIRRSIPASHATAAAARPRVINAP